MFAIVIYNLFCDFRSSNVPYLLNIPYTYIVFLYIRLKSSRNCKKYCLLENYKFSWKVVNQQSSDQIWNFCSESEPVTPNGELARHLFFSKKRYLLEKLSRLVKWLDFYNNLFFFFKLYRPHFPNFIFFYYNYSLNYRSILLQVFY